MSKFLMSAIAASLLGVCGAHSESNFSARLNYDAGQSAEQIYDALTIQARRACKSREASLRVRERMQADCRAMVVELAVTQINMPALVAVHRAKSGTPQPTIRLAAK